MCKNCVSIESFKHFDNRKDNVIIETLEVLKSIKDESQIKKLIMYWWSGEQILERIAEEMDTNYTRQVPLKDLKERLKYLKTLQQSRKNDKI